MFQREIDQIINPGLWRHSAPTSASASIGPSAIASAIETADPRLRTRWIPLESHVAADVWVEPRIDPATGVPYVIDFNQVFVDPATGAINGRRAYGPPTLNPVGLVPFIDMFHRTLSLPGLWGTWIMGLVALFWAFDCFVGAWLTFPRGRPFLSRWKTAWTIKKGASPVRLNMDLHRAGGLWLWGVLLIIAVSGVSFNLEHQAFEPVVSMVSPISENAFEHLPMDFARPKAPAFGFDEAVARARALADIPADVASSGLYYAAEIGGYGVAFGEAYRPGLGVTWVYIDAIDGHLIEVTRPAHGTGGDVFAQLQLPLHSGQILGLPTRLIVFFAGLATAGLSITGVAIYVVKRRARTKAKRPR